MRSALGAAGALPEGGADLADLEGGGAGAAARSVWAPRPTVANGPPCPPRWKATAATTATGWSVGSRYSASSTPRRS